MTQPTGGEPQDATAAEWPPRPQEAGGVSGPLADPPASGAPPAPSTPRGPNWALAVVGLLLLLVAGGQLAYLLGHRPDPDLRVGPQALIATGALLLLVGAAGLLTRRTRAVTRRRRQATRCR